MVLFFGIHRFAVQVLTRWYESGEDLMLCSDGIGSIVRLHRFRQLHPLQSELCRDVRRHSK
jgi:hypothetical protein